MSDLVWYVAYGSNLLLDRLACYLVGGKPPGAGRRMSGARDAAPPLAEAAQFVPHRLYFARESLVWQRGGVAFVDPDPEPEVRTLGRRYLITRDQFEDILRQENRDPGLELPAILTGEVRERVSDGWYGLVLGLGEMEGVPLVTCTNPEGVGESPIAPPSKAYLQCVIAGLREAFALNKQGVRRYLEDLPGIAGHYPGPAINKAFAATDALLTAE